MSNINLEDLSLHEEDEDEGFVFDMEGEGEEQVDFRWCLVGRFLCDRTIHVNSMKATMADVWRPVKGVKIKEAKKGIFLFQFSHELDMEGVLQGGPWNFDNHMLIMERVQVGVQIENIPLHHVDFWVQVHNLPVGLMAEKVGIKLANYIGSFVEYDKNNKSSFWRQYMRLRVRIDVRRPLKKERKIKNLGGEWCIVNFKYEKLGVFCFVCGILGHSENKCEVRFAMENDDGSREWSSDLRAEPRRRGGRPTSRWLNEEGGSSGTVGGGRSSSSEFNVGRPTVDPTRSNSPSTQPSGNPQSALIIPTVSVNHSAPIQEIHSQLSNLPNVTDPYQSIVPTTQSLPINNMSPILLFPNNDQPHHITSFPNNTINGQSLPMNNSTVPSFSLSQNITDAISQPFSFTSPAVAHIKHINMQLNRPVQLKPNQKINRPSTSLNRTGTTKNSTEPKPSLDRNSTETMEVQLEKKRRREEEKKDSDSTQHFLTAGPGSQACRDQ
jgi:14-3-3 protein epsilon